MKERQPAEETQAEGEGGQEIKVSIVNILREIRKGIWKPGASYENIGNIKNIQYYF